MAFITVDGENQIALKQGLLAPLNIVSFVLANIAGLGAEPVNRVEALPAASNIMATLPVSNSGYVNTNQVVYSSVMDSSVGDFDFNWVGLVDDEGVLIAATYIPLIQKRKTNGAIPGNNLTRNFLIAYSGIQATTAIAVPAATWQIDFTARLLGIDERERLSNYDIYGHEGFFDTGWSISRQGVSSVYDVLPGIGYVGGIRIAELLTQQVTAANLPASIWIDVSLQGDINDMSPVVAFAVDAVAHPDYTDGNGFNHYLTKLADLDASGNVTDVRVTASSIADHEAKADPHPQYLTQAEGDNGIALHEAKADPHSNYLLKSNIVTQAAAEAGTAVVARSWTAQRVKQAILALVKVASETVSGTAEIATQAETDAGADDARFVTPLKLKNTPLGLGAGQTRQNMLAFRINNTNYPNNTGQSIRVVVSTGISNNHSLYAYIDDTLEAHMGLDIGASIYNSLDIVVPAGSTYRFYSTKNIIDTWMEMR